MDEQQNIDTNAGDKKPDVKLPEETLVKLEGMGFTEKEGKPGLFIKNMDDVNFFWDFRKVKNGSAYASRIKQDGEGFEDVPRDELEQMEEYRVLRPDWGKKTEKKKTEKPKDKKKESPIVSVTDKKTGQTIQVENDGDAYTIMNIKDDEQVRQEIMGSYLKEFAYQFETSTKKKITGLSWAGVKEVARKQGNVSVEDIKITETGKTYRVLAKAKDIARNVTMFGVAEQSKKMMLKSKEEVEDLHALSKCVSRAQRNALRALIPELTIKTMIQEFLKKAPTG